MAMLRVASAARRLPRLRVLSGSVGSQDSEWGSCSQGSCQSLTEIRPPSGKPGFEFSKLGSVNRLGRSDVRTVSQIESSGVTLYRTVCQSSVQLAKKSSKGGFQNESKKKSSKQTSDIAKAILSPRHRAMVYECSVCTAMCVTRILKDPYERGVVIIRCMACQSVNLIQDQLGLFKEPGSMHKFLSDRGVDVVHGLERSYELTPENIAELDQVVQASGNG